MAILSESTWQATLLWLSAPSSIPTVWLPAMVTLWALLTVRTRLIDWALLTITTIATHHMSWVSVRQTEFHIEAGLHAIPVYIMAFFVLACYYGYRIDKRTAFAFAWLSILAVDFSSGTQINAMLPGTPPAPMGIGGGGWIDGLFIAPLAAVCCVMVAQRLRKASPDLVALSKRNVARIQARTAGARAARPTQRP